MFRIPSPDKRHDNNSLNASDLDLIICKSRYLESHDIWMFSDNLPKDLNLNNLYLFLQTLTTRAHGHYLIQSIWNFLLQIDKRAPICWHTNDRLIKTLECMLIYSNIRRTPKHGLRLIRTLHSCICISPLSSSSSSSSLHLLLNTSTWQHLCGILLKFDKQNKHEKESLQMLIEILNSQLKINKSSYFRIHWKSLIQMWIKKKQFQYILQYSTHIIQCSIRTQHYGLCNYVIQAFAYCVMLSKSDSHFSHQITNEHIFSLQKAWDILHSPDCSIHADRRHLSVIDPYLSKSPSNSTSSSSSSSSFNSIYHFQLFLFYFIFILFYFILFYFFLYYI